MTKSGYEASACVQRQSEWSNGGIKILSNTMTVNKDEFAEINKGKSACSIKMEMWLKEDAKMI